MPHCIVEYSKELESKIKPSVLIDKVYKGTLYSKLFIDADIKTRAISYKHHQTGDKKINFIHITIRILSGRSIEQQKILSNSILNEFKDIDAKPLSITIEICEIDNNSYSKVIY